MEMPQGVDDRPMQDESADKISKSPLLWTNISKRNKKDVISARHP